MAHVRRGLALITVSAVLAACGASGGGSGAPTADSSSGLAEPTATTAGGGGGGGGGANGSVVYQISGDYTTSGELPFVSTDLLSVFADEGWVAFFGEDTGNTILQMNTIPGSLIVDYGDAQVLVPGTEENGCTFTFTENDANGLAGSFECRGSTGVRLDGDTQITVDFSGSFDGHP